MKIELKQISSTSAAATIRNHQVVVDRPLEKGGSDQGPMGGEYFLTSVAGCFLSNLFAAINARGLGISAVHAEVIGSTADSPARFTALELLITAEGSDAGQLEHLVKVADHACIMMNTLRKTLDIRITVGSTKLKPAA